MRDFDAKEHLNTALLGMAARRGNFFSACALVISLILLALKALEKYNAEIDSLLQRILGR
jgi:hypothetical protein